MAEDKGIESREAKHGEKMIEIRVRFWTDSIAEADKIVPKNAWASGVVRMQGNKSHGIRPGNPKPFNSLLGLGSVIEQVLIDHNVKLQPSPRAKKYTR